MAVNAADDSWYLLDIVVIRNACGFLFHAVKCCRGIPVLGWRIGSKAACSEFLCVGDHLYLAARAAVCPHGRSDVSLRTGPSYDRRPG